MPLVQEQQQKSDKDEQDPEEDVQHLCAAVGGGEALESACGSGKEEVHHQDVHGDDRSDVQRVLTQQRLICVDELRGESQEEHDGLGIEQVDQDPAVEHHASGQLPPRDGSIGGHFRFGQQHSDSQIHQVGSSGISDDGKERWAIGYQDSNAGGDNHYMDEQGDLLSEDAPDGGTPALAHRIVHGVDGASTGSEADDDAGAEQGKPQ